MTDGRRKKKTLRLATVCIIRQLTKHCLAYIISSTLRRPREIGKDEENDCGEDTPFVGLAFWVRLLFLEDTRMVCSQRIKKTNAEVRLPFIGDTFAAFSCRETSLYTAMPGFCTQVSLCG